MQYDSGFGYYIRKYRWILLGIGILLILFLIYLFYRSHAKPTQQSFTITETEPKDGTTNMYTGESDISFKTNVPILSENAFEMSITPPLPKYWILENSYPTNEIIASVLGNFAASTKYTVTVIDKTTGKSYSWSFTTGDQVPQSSTGLEVQKNNQTVKDYYPLAPSLPFENNDFSIDYIDRLTLEVKIKNPDVEKVKRDVNTWIRQQGVDPATQTIEYINVF